MSGRNGGRAGIFLVICVNILLACAIVGLFYSYSTGYQNNIREQNIADITNINHSSANISSVYFQNKQSRLSDIVKYVQSQGLTVGETLSYIYDSSSGDTSFELVGADSKGYAAIPTEDGFKQVDYSSKSYESFSRIFTQADNASGIQCTQEFTDKVNAHKSFALYAHIMLPDANGTTAYYTLLAITQSSAMTDLINLDGGYNDMSTVLVNKQGDYLFGSEDFKSDNLFQYFYVFNGLSLDQEQELADGFASASSDGSYYYKDSKGRECVFVYTNVPGTEWRNVSCVPISSFHNYSVDLKYTLWIALLLLAMMCFDVAWLVVGNSRLRQSVQREKESSSAKTDFLSRMSHDIRTPLNVIIGSTILARDEDNPPKTQEHLENIDHSGKFLLSLINDILDFNKIESGMMDLHPEPYSLAKFRSNISSVIEPLCAEKGIRFEMTGDEPRGSYMLDPVRIEQIFFNLLSNSVKFTDAGGHIGLDCKAVPTQNGAMLEFVVSDDGCGMSDEFQKTMFDSFTQERNNETSKSQGSGLGLAIVKSLVDLMGGTISVESAPGQGTSFHIAIPATPAPDSPADEVHELAEAQSIAGKRVLLFEDNAINTQIAQALLERLGAEVESASDGVEGLDMFKASEPFFYDAILMDLRMPNMDGFEATRAIRKLARDDASSVPIIAMTANAYDEDVQKCLDAGMNAHLSKPIDPDALLSTLAEKTSRQG